MANPRFDFAQPTQLMGLIRHVDMALAGKVSSLQQLSAMLRIEASQGPIQVSILAKAEAVSPPTMSRLLTGLEASGLIKRAKLNGDGDGRAVPITLTAAGKKALRRAREQYAAALDG